MQCSYCFVAGPVVKMTRKELAMELDISPSTATRKVEKLVKLNLVSREIPGTNRRSVSLKLTDTGYKFYSDFQKHKKNFKTRVLQDFSNTEKEALLIALQKINQYSNRFIP